MVDAALAVLTINGQEREQLRNTIMHYSNFSPEHGGNTLHPSSVTVRHHAKMCCVGKIFSMRRLPHSFRRVSELTDQSRVYQRLNTLCHDPRVCFEYRLQTGDLLLVNNLTTLQASHTSSMHNEYWSIHLQPDSINSPWQPHNRIVEQAELTSA